MVVEQTNDGWRSSIANSSQRSPALMPQTRFKHAAGERDRPAVARRPQRCARPCRDLL